jgi:hypothetical protein
LYLNYYYFGLEFGPSWFYENNKLQKVIFSDFNKKIVAACNYDSAGILDSILQFNMNFISLDEFSSSKKMKNIFAYLPQFPNTIQKFTIGMSDKSHKDIELFPVKGENFIIDTLVSPLPVGYHYYLSCKIKALNSAIFKIYIEDIIDQ